MLAWDDLIRYLGVFFTIIATGFGFPLPEEVPIIAGGCMVSAASSDPESTLFWWIMLPMCIIAVVIGDGALYMIGRLWGVRLLELDWVKRKILPPEKKARIEKNFHEYGVGILLVARLLPGIRTPIFMMAGMIRLPLHRFLLADGIYAIPGVSAIFWLAYWFTDAFAGAFHKVEEYRPWIILGIVTIIVGVLAYKYLLRRHVATGDPEGIPLIGEQVAKIGGVLDHHHHHPLPPPLEPLPEQIEQQEKIRKTEEGAT